MPMASLKLALREQG